MMPAEPFRIKVVEKIKVTTNEERKKYLKEAGYNLFALKSEHVYVDLLSDSGSSAMSDEQWAALMRGDEAYASRRNFFTFEKAVKDVFGYEYVLPFHQGRAAEQTFYRFMAKPGEVIPSNSFFDTTCANVQDAGAKPLNLPYDRSYDVK
jgi:tyrosine phenol-lyase